MGKSWLMCVLMGTLAWGQAQPAAPVQSAPAQTPPAQSMPGMAMPGQAPAAENKPPAEVPMSAVVLTIKGVCPATPTAAPKTAATDKTAATTAAPAAKKPADCKTELTRAQFEKIANGLSANVTPQLKRQLEQALPRFMAMSEAAKKKGLDKTPRYQETLRIAKMQILTTELQQKVQEAADKAKQEKGEQELNALADSLRTRATASEDVVKLQKEAFEAGGQ